MKIIKLILHGYKRLSLGGVKTLTYTPKNKIQLILGTNGSGKSSLLVELWPWPADIKTEYLPDGYKQIHIEHKESLYVLKSWGTDGGVKHSFIKDDVELNTTNKKTLQMHLVSEHFNITNKIRDVLTGVDNFTTMSPNERKKWFISLSDMNYDYAMGVFNKLREEYRDAKGVIKMLQGRIASNAQSSLTEDDLLKLTTHITFLKDALLEITSRIPRVDVGLDKDEHLRAVRNLKRRLVKLTSLYETMNTTETLDDKMNRLSSIQGELRTIGNAYDETIHELDSMKSTEPASSALDQTTEEIEQAVSVYTTRKETLKKRIPITDVDYASLETTLINAHTLINDWVEVLPVSDHDLFSNTEHDNKVDALELVSRRLELAIKKRDDYEVEASSLEHSKEHNGQECPKCSYKWIPGYDASRLRFLTERLPVLENEIMACKASVGSLEAYMKDYNEYKVVSDRLYAACVENKTLHRVVSSLSVSGLAACQEEVTNNAQSLYTVWLPTAKEINETEAKLQILLKELDISRKWSEAEVKAHQARVSILEEKTNKLHREIKTKSEAIKSLEAEIATLKSIRTGRDLLNNLLRKHKSVVENEINKESAKYFHDIQNLIKVELTILEKRFLDNSTADKLIREDKKLLDEYLKKELNLKALVKHMSPDKGLIAESIVSFINAFIGKMNKVIESIWEYPIVISGCNLEEGDLNYRFPVVVGDGLPTRDVSKTSSSMKEVIDLAYRLSFMEVFGIGEYPIFADEFGKSMDEKHQSNAYKVVEELSNSGFEQVFIISHYQDCYGRFTHADVNVLHSGNLSHVVNGDTLVLD